MFTTAANFATTFELLTGNSPFPWQAALYERFVAGDIPATCNLPTGLGKTSVVAIGLIALANAPAAMPRRIVYVVNRRTVVDQTTSEVEKLRANLAKSGLLPRFQKLCSNLADPSPLAISTLRGQYADNAEWRGDPARPAVIVGTVDMIGSRLLFSGYGCGFKTRPTHAGLLGQDTLIVHDEAHLEPAFQQMLLRILAEQSRCHDIRPLRIMQLTATARDQADATLTFSLTADDFRNRTVARRMNASKALVLHPIDDEKQTSERVAELGFEHAGSNRAILVYLRRVEDVSKVIDQLRKKSGAHVEQLTGTLRGWERDQLARRNRVFARFLPAADRNPDVEPQPGTVYLVCTSAGEVGVNISADHLVCDLSTFESMAQRFGRVNRLGLDDADTRIDIVHPANLPTDFADVADGASDSAQQDPLYRIDVARQNTLALLRSLNGDGSPAALGNLPAKRRLAAFSPQPPVLEATDVLFDAWSLTTIRDRLPGRPPVAEWLHGAVEWEPPETQVAWRQDVAYLTNLLTPEQLVEALDGYPLKPHELLRDRTQRVFGHLETMAKRHGDKDVGVWRIDADGRIEPLTLKQIVEKDRQKKPVLDLADCTILLPPHAGGLEHGMLDGDAEYAPDRNEYDIADWLYESFADSTPPVQMRVRIWDDASLPDNGKWRLVDTFDTCPETGESDKEGFEAETGVRGDARTSVALDCGAPRTFTALLSSE